MKTGELKIWFWSEDVITGAGIFCDSLWSREGVNAGETKSLFSDVGADFIIFTCGAILGKTTVLKDFCSWLGVHTWIFLSGPGLGVAAGGFERVGEVPRLLSLFISPENGDAKVVCEFRIVLRRLK